MYNFTRDRLANIPINMRYTERNLCMCFHPNPGEKFEFRCPAGRWCTSYQAVAHRSHSRIRRFGEYGLAIPLASEGTRSGSSELFVLGERLRQDIRRESIAQFDNRSRKVACLVGQRPTAAVLLRRCTGSWVKTVKCLPRGRTLSAQR